VTGDLWLAIGLGAIVLAAIVYGFHLDRAMLRDDILNVLDEMADASRKTDAVDPHRQSSLGEP
jgi:hypothetical protein